jgi:hypothetical protein
MVSFRSSVTANKAHLGRGNIDGNTTHVEVRRRVGFAVIATARIASCVSLAWVRRNVKRRSWSSGLVGVVIRVLRVDLIVGAQLVRVHDKVP